MVGYYCGGRDARGPISKHRERIYDEAAALIEVAGLSWGEFWNTPRNILSEYVAACVRRQDRIRHEREARK